MRKTGRYENLGSTHSFIPHPLPPENPTLALTPEITAIYGQAMNSLGKLNEMAHRVPDIQRFIKAYVTKEALLSSAIEGVHTTLLDVFTQPLSESKPNKNTQLVMNYTKALDQALSLIKNDGLPISSRVILTAHRELMALGEGDKADPGNYRKQAVKVGNLVPPPAPMIPDLISQLEQFINNDESLPPLIKAGLTHVQFETIHPFLDGNGRIGRLLIVLQLVDSTLLHAPILYPSYYFKKHALEYYRTLNHVRTEGDFEGWITFYLNAIQASSADAYRRAKDIEKLETELATLFSKKSSASRENRVQGLAVLFKFPVISINELASQLGIAYNTASQIISDFTKENILIESTKQKRGKLFTFEQYLDILEREYEEQNFEIQK
ncbi:hypothetical protein CVU75_01905 [Candidatus Dependentiae bacterium HGW-Dependentiae-1]|nr:MAG: hypothetical protein CVU75_01905 [Candidatus Dependentiae bacterium HGW-Dependentiae-1]